MCYLQMEITARTIVCSWQVRTSLIAAEDPSTVVFKKKIQKKLLADKEASMLLRDVLLLLNVFKCFFLSVYLQCSYLQVLGCF